MKAVSSSSQQQASGQRFWKKPGTWISWLWLAIALIIYIGVYCWYSHTLETQPYLSPVYDPLRLFGIIAFVLFLPTAAYTLRRRFLRQLPGRVQNWLWLHTWFGIASILIAFLHANYLNILIDVQFTPRRFIEGAGGVAAMYSLLLLVISGIFGRLLDTWSARVIAREAGRNGVGIQQAVEEQIHEQELMLERLSAGKSPAFKQYGQQALKTRSLPKNAFATISPTEQQDFQSMLEVLEKCVQLRRSQQRQSHAHSIIRAWRLYIHIPLACLAITFVGAHSLLELAKMLLVAVLHR